MAKHIRKKCCYTRSYIQLVGRKTTMAFRMKLYIYNIVICIWFHQSFTGK